jgi:hypothetical protein
MGIMDELDVLAQEIADDMKTALEQIGLVARKQIPF